MKLLVDECLSVDFADRLGGAGHDAVHVTSVGLAGRPDRKVMAVALEQQRTIISADTDFGELLAQSGAVLPSIVLLRRSSHRPHDQATRLIAKPPRPRTRARRGAIAVITNDRVRGRPLPLS